MAIKNPYGVGDSWGVGVASQGHLCVLQPALHRGSWFVVLRTPPLPQKCPSCKSHNVAISVDEDLAALKDHAQRAREIAERAHAQLRAGMVEHDQALAERKRLGRALFEANEDRDYLRSQLRAVWALHVETPRGACSCGETPCLTREEANRGRGAARLPPCEMA